MRRRTATALAGVAASLAITAALWFTVGSPVFFLFVPFVPVLLGRRGSHASRRRCDTCGYSTTDRSHDFCPRDGTELTVESGEDARGDEPVDRH